MIFSIDFDGTLCENKYPEIGEANIHIINKCKELHRAGHQLILNTCRIDRLLNNALKWCEDQGLIFDAVNENIDIQINQFGGDCRKISADFYVDDKNISLDDFITFTDHPKIVCPVCGGPMDETYRGVQYCSSCEQYLLNG